MVELRTGKVLLRPARADDVTPLWEVFSRSDAMKYWSELRHATPARTTELVEGMIARGPDAPYFTVEHEGTAIGTAGFWQGNEVGFILHPRVWGKGVGGAVLDALIEHGFQACGFDDIIADVDPNNAASIGLLTSRGFVEIGRAQRTIQLGDVWADSVYLSLTAKAWSAR